MSDRLPGFVKDLKSGILSKVRLKRRKEIT
jgi:hypothetical protein